MKKFNNKFIIVLMGFILIFSSCDDPVTIGRKVTNSNSKPPRLITLTKPAISETKTQDVNKNPISQTPGQTAGQVAASSDPCASFIGIYTLDTFNKESNAAARLQSLKCAYQRGDNLALLTTDSGSLLNSATDKSDFESVKYLVETVKVQIDSKTIADGETPLMRVATRGSLQIVKYLISKGANPNLKNIYDLNLLMFAASSNNLETVKYCVETLGMSVNYKAHVTPDQYETPLIRSVMSPNSNLEITKYLLSKGADLNEKVELDRGDYRTAFMWAIYSNNNAAVNYLRESGAVPLSGFSLNEARNENCAGFSGAYDINRFYNQPDENIRFHELKCAYQRGDDLTSISANFFANMIDFKDLNSVVFFEEIYPQNLNINVTGHPFSEYAFYAIYHYYINDVLNRNISDAVKNTLPPILRYLLGKGVDTTLRNDNNSGLATNQTLCEYVKANSSSIPVWMELITLMHNCQ